MARELDELAEQIKLSIVKLGIEAKAKQLAELDEKMSSANFWADNETATAISKQAAGLKDEVDGWYGLEKELIDLRQLSDLEDAELQPELSQQLVSLKARYEKMQNQLLLQGPYDNHDAVLTVQSGAGGRDAQDWAAMLVRMYVRWAERTGMKLKTLNEASNEEGGIKNTTLAIAGRHAYGLLKNEHGVHRLVRKSPFNSAGSRETSFAMVEVLPSIDEPNEIEIDENDLKIDVYRAGGHGGQSVNTTDSAVRITHLPTAITVAIQNERSQLQNKETALKILRSKLAQLKLAQHKEKISDLKGPNQEAEWGNQIRSYVLHPYKLVKDSRSGYETSDVESVLGGDIDDLLAAGLKT